MCRQRLSIILGQGKIIKIRSCPQKKNVQRVVNYTPIPVQMGRTFHACSSKKITVKFKVQTKQFFQEIVLLQMLS